MRKPSSNKDRKYEPAIARRAAVRSSPPQNSCDGEHGFVPKQQHTCPGQRKPGHFHLPPSRDVRNHSDSESATQSSVLLLNLATDSMTDIFKSVPDV